MRSDGISGTFVNRWTDDRQGVVSVHEGVARFESAWSSKNLRRKAETRHKGDGQNLHSFYRLPNGTKITLEQLVIILPVENLFRRAVVTFSIADIRFFALAECNILLSYRQTRNALYRINHGKLLFRHIQRGVYTWEL